MLNINKKIRFEIDKHLDLSNMKYLLLKTKNIYNIENYDKKIDLFINLGLINNIRRINKFHESVNLKLDFGGFYIVCSETLEERRRRVNMKYPYGMKTIFRIIDFIYKRVFPKLPLFKRIYFSLTQGNNRVISKAEILGRLFSCGFDIINYFECNNLLYVISKKVKKPEYNFFASYSPIFKMKRIGYKGQDINVYKLRTMYPYSEYLQDFIIKENKLARSGKVLNDYRITTWGKLCRKFWLDELPMFINFFKGQLGLVGVRPLSRGYFKKYPKYLQELRIKVKPGLIPPYYADLPNNFNDILKSEEVYIKQKLLYPIVTDLKYFSYAFLNIVFRGARSK